MNWLDKFQDGGNVEYDYVNYGTPEYEKAYNQGRFANVPNPLDEVVVNPYDREYPFYQSLTSQEKKHINDKGSIGRGVRRKASTDIGLAEDTLDVVNPLLYGVAGGFLAPYAIAPITHGLGAAGMASAPFIEGAMASSIPGLASIPGATVGNVLVAGGVGLSTNELVNPQSATRQSIGTAIEEPTFSNIAKATGNSALTAAGFIIPNYGTGIASMADDAIRASNYLTTQTPLKNAYKLNPYAFKPNPEAYYRGIGKEGMEDALQSGVFRPKNAAATKKEFTTESGEVFNFGKSFDKTYYSPDFKIADRYGKGFVAEVPQNSAAFNRRYSNKDWSYHTESQIPIDQGRILQKDWLKGYKEIPKPTSSLDDVSKGFKSEIGNIDYRKNPLSDKEKEMYQWFDEQMRFDKLPQTTNKQSIEVLDNFKQRINTPEGQKRLKELGITEEQLLQDLKIVEDPNTFGYYRGEKNTIAINPEHPLPKKVVRHEIEHGVQNALRKSKINKVIDGTPDEKLKALESTTTEIDDILSGLTLRREGTPDKKWIGKAVSDKPVQIDDYKALINNKQNATDYFLTGSDGAEKSAFLGEVQQYMMDTGKIPKNSYVEITPEMVKETMMDAMFDEIGGGKYLRLFNIIKADPKNYEIISKGLNKMLSISPLIGATAATQLGQEEIPQYQQGGIIKDNRGQWAHPGEITEINSPYITMKNVPYPVLGISDTGDTQMMYPEEEYEFDGNKVTEYPLVKNGKELVKLNQLTNFTNYNTKQPGGWLEKYN